MTDTTMYADFVAAQAAFAPALKTSTNPAFKSRYAALDACIEAVIDALNANGFGLIQRTHPDDKGVTVETILMHRSGQSISGGTLHVPAAKHDPQGYGSALTYARRYSLMATCGIAPEDDDGQAASGKARADARTRWLAQQREAIQGAKSSGDLKRIWAAAIEAAEREEDGEAVAQINAWGEAKLATAKAAAAKAQEAA